MTMTLIRSILVLLALAQAPAPAPRDVTPAAPDLSAAIAQLQASIDATAARINTDIASLRDQVAKLKAMATATPASSLRIQGQWTTRTAAPGNFLMGQSKCSLQFRFRANAFVAGGTEILKTFGGNPLYITATGDATSPGISIQLQGTSGTLQRTIPYTPGTGCAFGISWDAAGSQIIWSQGTTWGGTTGLGNTIAGSQPFVLGPSTSFGAADFQVADVAILHGATWNSGDFADYASRAKDPSQLSTPATYWWPLGGTPDAAANPATDAGFLDRMGSGVRFGAATGTGLGVYSPDRLIADANGAVLDAYVSRSGRLFFALLGSSHAGFEMIGNSGRFVGTGKPSPVVALSGTQPTIKVNGTPAVLNPATSTQGAFWSSSVNHLDPWVAYQLRDAVKPGDVITWQAPAGWAAIANGALPAVAADTSAANYAGVLEPAFRVPENGLTMETGVMLGAIPGLSYRAFSPIANRRRSANNPGGGTGARVYTLDGGLVSWPDGANPTTHIADIITQPNYLDGHGVPYLQGPTLVASGGSGAVLIPVISAGAIRSIVVKSGGTGYSNSGTVSVLYGGGWDGAATYTASGGIIRSATVTAGGGGYSDGLWKLGYGDAAPQTPTALSLTNGLPDQVWIPLQGLPSPLGDRWVAAVGGSARKAWYNCLVPNPGLWSPSIDLTYAGGAVANGTHTNGATDIRIAPPNVELEQCAGLSPDPNTLDWLSFGKDRYAGTIRFMESQLGGGGDATHVDYATLPQPWWWSYSGPIEYLPPARSPLQAGRYTGAIAAIRTYDPAGPAQRVFVDGSWPGAVAQPGGSLAPYAWTPPDRSWTQGGVALEVATPAPHQLKTGALLWLGTTAGRIWVTAPDRFILPGLASGTIQGLTNPPTFTWVLPSPGTIPVEACCRLANALPGCVPWFVLSMTASDAHVDAFADAVLAVLPTGRKARFELSNEVWNYGYGAFVQNLIAGRLSGQGLDSWQTYAARAAAVHARIAAKFAAAGRPNDLIRVFGSWFTNPAMSREIIAYANARKIPIDEIAIAPYRDFPAESAWGIAAASVASGDTRSFMSGTAWPWTMAMYHELWRHHVLYEGLATGFLDGHNAILDGYTTGPRPRLTAYEGGIQDAIPPWVGADNVHNSTPHDGLTHDFFFSPDMADLVSTYHLWLAKNGFTASAYTSLCGPPPTWDNLWILVTHAGQRAGAGDGSDGKAVNRYWLDDGKSHLLENVSPALEGLRRATPAATVPVPTRRRKAA
jgi:hypothetical protein